MRVPKRKNPPGGRQKSRGEERDRPDETYSKRDSR